MDEKNLIGKWIYCPKGKGFKYDESGQISKQNKEFNKFSVGIIQATEKGVVTVWLIGINQKWDIPVNETSPLKIKKTGDRFDKKVCNICHRLLPIESFEPNQTNTKSEVIRRPSCRDCRVDIEGKSMAPDKKSLAQDNAPKEGEVFKCPICQKRSIVGITAKIVVDHNRHTGKFRDYICDSCNTGLGRFKNGEDYLQNAIEYVKKYDG